MDFSYRVQYEKQFQSVSNFLLKSADLSTVVKKSTIHPQHYNLIERINHALVLNQKKSLCINFGDSLTFYVRHLIKPHCPIVAALPGVWPHHMRELIRLVGQRIHIKHLHVPVVSLGTGVINPRILFHDFGTVKDEHAKTLAVLRRTFPDTRICVYGAAPPCCFNRDSQKRFDDQLIRFVANDPNAVMISLQSMGRGFLYQFPNFKWNSGGLAFTERGFARFNAALRIAHTSKKAGIIIQA